MDEVGRQLGVAFANARAAAAAQSHSHGHLVSHSGKGQSHTHGPSQSFGGGVGGLGGVGVGQGLGGGGGGGGGRGRRDMSSRVRDVVQSLALCHNVTPVWDDAEPSSSSGSGAPEDGNEASGGGAGVGGPLIPGTDGTGNENVGQTKMKYPKGTPTYQASSPDEVAIVSWTEEIGLALVYRDRGRIVLRAGPPPSSSSRSRSQGGLGLDGRGGDTQFAIGEDDEGEEEEDATLLSSPGGGRSPRRSTTTYSYAGNANPGEDNAEEEDTSTYLTFDILSIFPFTSESKRMGIIIRETTKGGRGEGEIWFLLKGMYVPLWGVYEFSLFW